MNQYQTKSHKSRKIVGREWAAILAVLLLAFALRTVALTRVPPGLHNDEVADAEITESVVGGRLAIFFPENIGNEGLHYYFAAPFMAVLGKTLFALRLPAVFLSMMAMSVIWALARRLFGPVAALSALTGFAIVFWTVEFGRIVLHVVMEVPLAALAAYCLWRARAARGRRAWGLWALSGLWIGLAIDAYTAARILPVILIAYGAYIWIAHRAEARRVWVGIALALAVTALVVLPLALYLLQNPTVDQLNFFDIDRPWVELRQGNLLPAIETSLRTLGMFAFVGDPLYYDVPGRPIFEPAGALLLAGGLLLALRRWRQPEYAFAAMWFLISLAPGMLSQPAPNYTRTLGVQVVLFALPGIAIAYLLDRWRSKLVYIFLALLFVGNLAWTARDYFYVWPSIDTVRFWHQAGLKATADYAQNDPNSSPVAICVPSHLVNESDVWWIPAWRHMRFLLHRSDLALCYYDCTDAMVFTDGPTRYAFPDIAAQSDLEHYPFYAQFLAGVSPDLDFLPERLGVVVRADKTPASDRLRAALKDHLAHTADSQVAWAPEANAANESARLPINFQDVVEFLGYTFSDNTLAPGESLELTTWWRVTGGLPAGLSQFTHVLDASGAIVTQQDGLALASASLRPGDVFAQIHHLALPSDLPEGTCSLTIGLYTPADGLRLQIRQNSQPRGERLWLIPLNIKK